MSKRMLLSFLGLFCVFGLFSYLFFSSDHSALPPATPKDMDVSPISPPAFTPSIPAPAPAVYPLGDSSAQAAEAGEETEPYCYIGEFNGHLCIFAGVDSPIPDIITDIVLSSLPETDRQTIRQGLFLYSEAELSKLLEDLGS